MLLNFQQLGEDLSDPPVIVLHGLFASQRNWRSIAIKLSEQRRVIPVDLRNHGDSFHAESMTYSGMADDIFELQDHLQLGPVTLLGHSMGGKVAMSCALEQPERIAGLCVADISPCTYFHDHQNLIDAMKSLPLSEVQSRTVADKMLSDPVPLKMLRQFLLQNLSVNEEGSRWRINISGIEKSLPSIMSFPDYDSVFAGKTLFIRGENSDYIRADHHSRIRQYFPNNQQMAIANAGHWLHAEQPALFLKKITEYLDENAL